MAKGRRRRQENIGQKVIGTLAALISYAMDRGPRQDRKSQTPAISA